MLKSTRSFYLFFSAFLLSGWIWLLFQFSTFPHFPSHPVCIFKHVTGIPCPSCGVTRALEAFYQGDYHSAFLINPLFLPIFFALLFFPCWIVFDFISKRVSFMNAYDSFQKVFQKPIIWIPFFGLLLVNWIWNIAKGN
ncbi:MAG: DUF2752 domain-containing protein [Chloroherpetonaceae bacterium]|nr:DUF2752 domain-containing protein [Chloroherpetonaceae bacterium]